MAAVSSNFGDLLLPGIRKVFFDAYGRLQSMIPFLYNVSGSNTSYEQDTQVGSFSDVPEFNGTIQYDDIYQGYDTTYTHKEFAKGFKIERKLYDDDLYRIIMKAPQGLGTAAARTKEKHAADLFNNAFTANPDFMSGGDGTTLCSSSHGSTAPDGITQSNTGSSALSPTALEATRIAMLDFRDDRGEKIVVAPDLLLVPRNLEETAWEIINSQGKVDTADNNRNFHYGKYKLAVWDFLTDANNWFLIDSELASMFLNFFNRIPLELNRDRDFDTYIAKYSVYMRYSLGYSDWRWVFGHNVS